MTESMNFCPRCGGKLIMITSGRLYIEHPFEYPFKNTFGTTVTITTTTGNMEFIPVDIMACLSCNTVYIASISEHSQVFKPVGKLTDEVSTALLALEIKE